MPSLPDQIASSFTEYWAIVAGSLIVATYAKRRFNEPTFPSCKALPQAVEPLRYLFLKPQYRRARWAYVVLTLMLYVLIVLPGPVIINIVGIDQKTFPPQAWSLLIALVLVGLLPNSSNFKWIFDLEQELRRFVHEHYLVPRRVEETITLLQDVSFQPPASYIASLPNTLRAKIYDGLKAPTNSLAHRWARVTMLMELQS